MEDSSIRDRAVWERVFAALPADWYEAPPSDAMRRGRAYFEAHPCTRVLDVGCGFGRWAQFLAGHGVGESVGLDYAEGGIRAAAAWAGREGFNARFVAGSATALPFDGRPFDGVLAALLLEP
jgi:ubiquinone/menaquinone biosynthesis C-methylase UbiE